MVPLILGVSDVYLEDGPFGSMVHTCFALHDDGKILTGLSLPLKLPVLTGQF